MININEIENYGINKSDIDYYLNKLKNNTYIAAVTGEFSSGKTCFINCLLNKKDFLPHANGECTPILIEMFKGDSDKITLRYFDGKTAGEPFIRSNIKKYATYTDDYDSRILSMEIPLSDFDFGNQLHIIDTPGTNTIKKEHEKITSLIINKADMIIYVLNKVVTESDIKLISKIKKSTDNLVFVLTHMDEIDSKTGNPYSEAKIELLCNEAAEQISKGLNMSKDDIMIFPLGSIAAYDNPKYIDEIKDSIKGYINDISTQSRKNQITKQIGNLIERRIAALQQEKNIVEAAAKTQEQSLDKKYKKYQNERAELDAVQKRQMDELLEDIEENQKKRTISIKDKLDRKKNELVDYINGNLDIDEDDIKNAVEDANREIGKNIRRELEEDINNIVKDRYEEASDEIRKVVGLFDENIEINLSAPDVSELGQSSYSLNIVNTRRKLAECQEALMNMENDSTSELETQEYRKKLEELEKQKIEFEKSIAVLGDYIPEYSEETEGGGAEAGKKFGRVLGEVADVALLVWNPAAGAVAAAGSAAKGIKVFDTVKDVIKSTQIIGRVANSVSSLKKSEPEKKLSIDERAKKLDNTRKKMRTEIENSGSDSLTGLLDVLSIGFWGEKIGGGIGSIIKPSKTILIEDEEKKQAYNETRKQLIAERDAIRSQIDLARENLNSSDNSMAKAMKLKKQLADNEKHLQNVLNSLEESEKQYKENAVKENMRKYYEKEFTSLFNKQYDNCVNVIKAVYDKISEKLIEKLTVDFDSEVLKYDNLFEKISKDKEACSDNIKKIEADIKALSEYKEFVPKWIEA